MKVITIANQKGGIGKTTTAVTISTILAKRGYKTLLIDADQQCNSTDNFRANYDGVPTLYDVMLDNNHISLNKAVQHTEVGDIVAGDPLLRDADNILSNDLEGEYRLINAIENLTGYDYVIIDTAPALNWMLRNVLIASDLLVIPVTTDRFALTGFSQLIETVQFTKKRKNQKLKVAGLLIIKYKEGQTLAKEVVEIFNDFAEKLETKVFNSKIRECVKTQQAQAKRISLIEYDPKCTTAIDYNSFIDELLKGED